MGALALRRLAWEDRQEVDEFRVCDAVHRKLPEPSNETGGKESRGRVFCAGPKLICTLTLLTSGENYVRECGVVLQPSRDVLDGRYPNQ